MTRSLMRRIVPVAALLAAVAIGLTWVACSRGPRHHEVRTFILSSTPDATEVDILRDDQDATGGIWVRVRKRDGSGDELGYEFVDRWVWPWQTYFAAEGQ